MRALPLAPLLAALLAVTTLTAAPAAAQTAAATAPAEWKLWRYPDLHLMFRGPPDATPTLEHGTASVGGLQVPQHTVVARNTGHTAYMIGVTDMTGNTQVLNVDGVPPAAVSGMSGHLIGPVRTLPWTGGDAREYDAATPTYVIRARAIVVGRRLTQAMVITDASAVPADAEAFLAGVTPLP